MSFKSETYLVLIASPSGLAEERQVATEAVNDWNELRAVGLPLYSAHSYSVSQERRLQAICTAK